MTIGIDVCLSDGALLIADGLTVLPMRQNLVISNDSRKISQMGSNLGLIQVGVTQGTIPALAAMNRSTLETANSPEVVMREFGQVANYGWIYLLSRLAPDVDRNNENLRVGFLVGGYIRSMQREGFIGGVLYTPNGHDAPIIRTREKQFIVLGGENEGSQRLFKEYAEREWDQLETRGTGVQDNIVNALLRAGKRTILEVSQLNPRIGGTIRYMIIRRGYPIYEGICM